MDTKRLKSYLAVLMIIAFIGLIYSMLQTVIPRDNNDAMMILLGAMVGIIKDLYGYYFGSSEGSQRKTELLGGAANANPGA